MCEFLSSIHQACRELAEQGKEFDMLQIRNKTRELTGPDTDVRFHPCKFEALAFFENGGFPGYALVTKDITIQTPVFWEGEGSSTSPAPNGATEDTTKSVFSFVPLTVLLDRIQPAV